MACSRKECTASPVSRGEKQVRPVSSVAMAAISLSDSAKSKMARFCRMRSGFADLTTGTTPRCVSQRSTICGTDDLRYRFVVDARDMGEQVIIQQFRMSCGQRRPCLHDDAMFVQVASVVFALIKGVALDYVDGGLAVVEEQKVGHAIRGEVVHADGTCQSFILHFAECAPRAVVVVVRLVDEQQIHVVHAEPFQGTFHPFACAVVASVGDPQLGGDEDLVSCHAAAAYGGPYRTLVAVGGGRVDETVAGLDRLGHRVLAYDRIGHAEHPVADAWYAVPVVQCQIAVIRIHWCSLACRA